MFPSLTDSQYLQALYCLSEDIQCSVELASQQVSLACSLLSLPALRLSQCAGGGLAGLREAIENHGDNQLSQVVAALQTVNIPAEDILRVLTAARLLSSWSPEGTRETNQRMNVMRDSAELLGVSEELLTNILNENQNIAGLGCLTARLSGFLTVRTIQSIVKKVNRTIKRRFALKILCSASSDRKKFSPTTIRIANHPVSSEVGVTAPWLPQAVMQMFHDNSLCHFGFASHLFQPDSDSLISPDIFPPPPPPHPRVVPTLFCLDVGAGLVQQVRSLGVLEAVLAGQDCSLWRCYSAGEFSSRFRVLASRTCRDEAETVFSLLDLVADCEEVEICQEAATIMLGRPAQLRLEELLEERRERSARRIQAWWRRRQHSLAESHLIQTVLIKYESLQRQSESLVYSFADRTIR